jgi:hypothetical protein
MGLCWHHMLLGSLVRTKIPKVLKQQQVHMEIARRYILLLNNCCADSTLYIGHFSTYTLCTVLPTQLVQPGWWSRGQNWPSAALAHLHKPVCPSQDCRCSTNSCSSTYSSTFIHHTSYNPSRRHSHSKPRDHTSLKWKFRIWQVLTARSTTHPLLPRHRAALSWVEVIWSPHCKWLWDSHQILGRVLQKIKDVWQKLSLGLD